MTAQRAFTALGAVVVACGLALGLAGTAPASPPEPVGAKINVFLGTPTTFVAGQPFHILHGWGVGATDGPEQAGLWKFQLEMDGVEREADFVIRSADPAPKTDFERTVLNRFWVFEFPEGMSGRHTFTGHWLGPCRPAVEAGIHPGPCGKPNELVEIAVRSLTVDFVRPNLALGTNVTASNEFPGNPATFAVDGSWWSYWSAGGFPSQWIEVDLGEPKSVAEVRLGITQLPDSHTVHRVYGRASTAEPYTLLQEFSGFTVDQQILTYSGAPRELRYIRVETVSSSSWVGWREVEVFGP
jgi:hypothetical protein